ncbi:MAG: hypothetical protein FD123_2190 [Bacteroidetes bacterium]|nr:MAG: hypothetical protein FD123_2190 [Bacteroidota bacterium]
MSPEEQGVFRGFLTSFDSRGERFNSKSVKLLDLLCSSHGNISDHEVEFYVYGKRATMAFSRLLIRFRDKLVESLLLDVNVKREGAYSEQFRYLFEVRKKICCAQIFVGRGLYEIALFLYDTAAETSGKYEFYEELLQVLRLKMQLAALTQGKEEFQRIMREYRKYEACQAAAFAAYCDYNLLVGETVFKGRQEDHGRFLLQSISRMRRDYQETGSANVAFYLYYLEAQHFQELHFFRHARKSLMKLAALVEKFPAVHVPYRLGNVLINLADNDLFLHQFDRAVETCSRARPLLKTGSYNEFQCMETEFYGHYYSGRYDHARMLLLELLESDNEKNASFRHGKRQYLLACTLFMQGEYKEVHELLAEHNEIERDREGWNVGIRILSIMNDLERALNDSAGKKIENARKHLRKLEQQEKLRRREQLIYEVLRELDNRSYDFKAVHQSLAGHFEALRSNDGENCWQVRSPEMIIFHEWFLAHVIRIKYVQKTPKYTEPVGLVMPVNGPASFLPEGEDGVTI